MSFRLIEDIPQENEGRYRLIEEPDDGIPTISQGKPDSTLDNMWDTVKQFLGTSAEAEKAKAHNALVYSQMLGIKPSVAYDYHDEISAQVQEKLASEKIFTEKKGIGGAYEAGKQSSIYGMLKNQQVAKPFETVSQLEKFVHGFTQMSYDSPFFLGGAGLSTLSGGGVVGGFAGGFGLTAGLRQVLIDKYSKGEAKDAAEFFDRMISAIKETIKGQIVGGLTGSARVFAPTLWTKVGGTAGQHPAAWTIMNELATMTAAGKLIEGHIPTAQDFVDNAGLLLAMHMGAKGYSVTKAKVSDVSNLLKKGFVEDGVHPEVIVKKMSESTQVDADINKTVADLIQRAKDELPTDLPKQEVKTEAKEEGKQKEPSQMTREELESQGYIPIYRGAGPRGFKEIRATENGVFGDGVYFYTEPMPARSHATTGGGVITGFIKPEDALIKGNVVVIKDVSKIIERGKISVEDTLSTGAEWIQRTEKALSEGKAETKEQTPTMEGTGEPTSITQKNIDAERTARGEDNVEKIKAGTPQENMERGKRAVESGDVDPKQIINEIHAKVEGGEDFDISKTKQGAVAYELQRLKNYGEYLEEQIRKGEKEGEDVSGLKDSLAQVIYDRSRAENVLSWMGTSESGMFAARKAIMNADYTYAGIVTRMMRDGIEMTPERRAEIQKIADEFKAKMAEAEEAAYQRGLAAAEKGVKKIRLEEGLTKRREKRQVKVEDLDAEFDRLTKELNKELGGLHDITTIAPLTKYVVILAKNRIQKGVVKAVDIVDQIYTKFQEAGLSFTKREIADALSGYGITTELSKDKVDAALREAKAQLRLLSALEDAQKGEIPKRSGLQRGEPSNDVRELQKAVKQAMREAGIDTETAKTPEEQWKTSLDAVKTRLKNTIFDIQKRLLTGEKAPKKKGIVYDEEANLLKELRDGLKDIVTEIEGKPEMSPEQKAKLAMAAVEKSIAKWEGDIEKLMQGKTPEKAQKKGGDVDPAVAEARAYRDELRQIAAAMKKELSNRLTPEEQALRDFRKNLEAQVKRYEKLLAENDFAPKEKKDIPQLGDAEIKIQAKLEELKKQVAEKRYDWKYEQMTTGQRTKEQIIQALDLIKAIKSSWDVSAPGRQGFMYVLSHPLLASKNIMDMFKAMRTDEAAFEVTKRIQTDPLYNEMLKAKIEFTEIGGQGLGKYEEMYRSKWAQMVPGIPMSERAYVSFLNLARANLFKEMYKNNFSGREATAKELEWLGKFVNEATGRGTVKGMENALAGAGTILWAPKLYLSRFQLALGHAAWGGTAASRIAVAKEYARALTSLGIIYTLASLAGADIEDDPRSSDFGKIVFGNTRIDPLAGISQATVLMARLATRETKKLSGAIVPLTGDDVPYKGDTIWSVAGRFLQSKLTPVLGMAGAYWEGKDFVGKPKGWETVPLDVLPLSFGDIYQAMDEEGVPAGAALSMLALFGIGLQIHNQ